MEEEVNYSTVVFKNGHTPSKDVATVVHAENKEEPTIYSEVKPASPATTAPDGEAAAAHSDPRVLAFCVGILCVLLLASIGAIVYVSTIMKQNEANISNLKSENQELGVEKSALERETQELSRVIDDLNWTMGVILNFNTFPVNEFCSDKKCQPCRKGWILYQDKCYLFTDDPVPWEAWEDSRKVCQNQDADLVVIDDLQEQEFIYRHIKYYYDRCHGYWIGLRETADKIWVWIDGRNDTLGFWVDEELSTRGEYTLLIPGRTPTASWDPAEFMWNKFICETDALIRST